MKAILEFNLPEESEEHRTAVNGALWMSAMWDLSQWLRSEVKYGGKEAYQPVRDMMYEIINEAGLTLE